MDYQILLNKSDEEYKHIHTPEMPTPEMPTHDLSTPDLSTSDLSTPDLQLHNYETLTHTERLPVKIETEAGENEPQMAQTKTTYVTDFSKRLVYSCIQNSDDECMFNYTYKELLIDMYIIYQSQTYNHTQISIHLLSYKYKLLFIMYSIIYNQTIYLQLLKNDSTTIQLTDIDVINIKDLWLEKKNVPDNILEIYNESLQESYLHINSLLIHYKQDIEYKTDWEDIRLFSSEYSKIFISTLHKKKNIYISNLNEIYFIYFIPIAIILNKKLIINKEDIVDINDTLTIGDHTSTGHKDILIMNKYSNTIDIHYNNSIFFNYTINQFIIHTIKLKKTYMVGTLFSYISINNNILYYKNYTLQVPKTYILDKNILYIKKKYTTY